MLRALIINKGFKKQLDHKRFTWGLKEKQTFLDFRKAHTGVQLCM